MCFFSLNYFLFFSPLDVTEWTKKVGGLCACVCIFLPFLFIWMSRNE